MYFPKLHPTIVGISIYTFPLNASPTSFLHLAYCMMLLVGGTFVCYYLIEAFIDIMKRIPEGAYAFCPVKSD